jgi:hypothetical protein
MSHSWRKRRLMQAVSVSVIAAVGLSACTPDRFPSLVTSQGAIDPADPCGPQRAALQEHDSFFSSGVTRIITGALIGGATTLIVGQLTGARGSAGQQFLAGALGGALTSVVANYLSQARSGASNPDEVSNRVRADIAQDNDRIVQAQAALDELNACREREARAIGDAYRAQRISLEEARSRMAVVRERRDADLQVANRIAENLGRRGELFVGASSELQPGALEREQQRLANAFNAAVVRSAAGTESPGRGPTTLRLEAGQLVRVLETQGARQRVTVASGETGWVEAAALVREQRPARRTVSAAGPIVSAPRNGASTIRTASAGQTLVVTGRSGQFAIVDLGGGNRGFIRDRAFATQADDGAVVEASAGGLGQTTVADATLTNISRREGFQRSLQSAQASGSAFELS